MIWLTVWLIKVTIKLMVLSAIACAYLIWLPIALSVMVVASARGNQRVVGQYRRSLAWKMPRI